MCSMDDRDTCSLDKKLVSLSDDFKAMKREIGDLRDTVKRLIASYESHDKVVVWLKRGGWTLLGIGIGTGILKLTHLAAFI